MLPLAYSWKNLWSRPVRTTMTVTVVALVVVASSLFLGLISSLKRTLVSTGHPLNLVVLRKGSDNDGASALSQAAYQAIRFYDGIARNASDQPLVSPELVVQPFFWTPEGNRENVLVRGVEPVALEVHEQVKIVSGRMFRPSSSEAIVGKSLVGRYEGANLGGTLKFGRGRWTVVGVFEAGGSSFESEVWVDVRELANDAKRPLPYSGIRLRANSEAELWSLKQRIEADPRYALQAERESDYYAKQSESANSLYVLVVAIALFSGIGAGFGAANTMYAAVQSRVAEIGTLRALGFSRRSILVAFQLEAVFLALLGFAVGAVAVLLLAASLGQWLRGIGFGAATFTTNVVQLQIGIGDLAASLLLTLAIGLLAGLGPAARAARMPPIEALRRG
ncbi:Macrolide export ATP-binding/permease protein MacB [bacterium HR30]|nr:Macrolide export ATP-binding/permease protein MacB [bacterium HR30]